MRPDHLLVIGFGGPEKAGDILPYLEEVTRGLPIPKERLLEVAHHYEVIGGKSPYNAHTARLTQALEAALAVKGISLPVFTGMRNWHPFLKETVTEIRVRGLRRGIALILATHRSEASWDKYLRSLEESLKACGADIPYALVEPWFEDPLFIEAQAERVREAAKTLSPETPVLFSAHSIPCDMAARSRYAEETLRSAELVAARLGISKWRLAWQSRSGSPRQPWLEPDVLSIIRELAAAGAKDVLLVPVGFLCDNAEVLFDLDVEARQEAEKLGMSYYRAATVMEHPAFVEALARRVQTLAVSPPL